MRTIRAHIEEGEHIQPHPTSRESRVAFGLFVQESRSTFFLEIDDDIIASARMAEIEAVTKYFTVRDHFHAEGPDRERETGDYCFRSAQARVERDQNHNHTVIADGPILSHALRLSYLIRRGKIAPAESFEERQVKSSAVGVKQAFLNLIEAISIAFSQWRLRWVK